MANQDDKTEQSQHDQPDHYGQRDQYGLAGPRRPYWMSGQGESATEGEDAMATATPTTFGAWLRAQRKEQDLTQEALSERAGCSPEMVRKIEAGTARPSRQLAELLAAALDVPPAERAGFVRWARGSASHPGQPDLRAGEPTGSGAAGPFAIPNPYKGLRAFQEADAPDFFGREALTSHLLTRLAEDDPLSHFLAVVGPSGSGKSSVVRAGLVPALRHNGVPGSARWTAVEVVPGSHPFDELEAALLRYAINPPPSLMPQLREDDRGLLRAVKRSLPADPAAGMLLLIDQFEELFTLVEDEAARQHFLSSLYAAVTEPRSPVRVVVTLRADFYDRPLLYQQPAALLGERTEVVPPMAPDELERASVGPAGRVGVTLEPQLLAALIADTGSQPGMLPLLQYALTELFEQRDGLRLTLGAYHRSGGVTGTLGRRADALYTSQTAAEQAETRQLFLRLITLGDGIEDTRRRVRRSELASAARNEEALDRVLEAFGQARLLTFDRDPASGVPTVEVAHEALLGSWERLRTWLDASRDSLRVQRRLLVATGEWATAGQDHSYLASGARLAQFEAMAAEGDLALTEEERGYLAASLGERRRQEQAEYERQAHELELAQQSAEAAQRAAAESQRAAAAQRSAANRLRGLVIALGIFLLAAAALTLFALDRSQTAERNATEANTQRLNAQTSAQTAVASEQQAQADFQRADAQRLAAEANRLLALHGNADVIALLSIRSLHTQYSPQGDAALQGASSLEYPEKLLTGLATNVRGAAFSPDGKYLVTGGGRSGAEGVVQVWDVEAGRELWHFDGVAGDLRWTQGVAFSPDGKYVLAASHDKSAHLLDAQTGAEVRRFLAGADLRGVAFSPDGRTVLAGAADGTARLWDTETGAEVRRFSGHTAAVYPVAFSPDGKYVLTGSLDQTVRLWDAQTGAEVHSFTGLRSRALTVQFSPDGRQVLSGALIESLLWDAQTGDVVQRFENDTGEVTAQSFSPDGKTIATAGALTVHIWDAATGGELRRLAAHTDGVWGLAYSPDGRYLATASMDRTIGLWPAQGPGGLPQFGRPGSVVWAVYSPDGTTVLTMHPDRSAVLWDARTGALLHRLIGHTSVPNSGVFTLDGKYVLTADGSGTVRQWDVLAGTEVRHFDEPGITIRELAISPDGNYLLVSTLNASSPGARLWDVRTAQQIRKFADAAWVVTFSPDGKYVLAGSSDPVARLWDMQSGQLVRTFTGHKDAVNAVAFSPDGRTVLTGSRDGTARLWDAQTGAEVRQFIGHSLGVLYIHLSADGKWVLTSGLDNTARVWNAETGQEVRRFVGPTRGIKEVSFSPDGEYVLMNDTNAIIRLAYAKLDDGLADLCARVPRDFSDAERTAYNIEDQTPACPNR